jgi:hypothetical protein
MDTPTKFPRFLELPTELRDLVYSFSVPECRAGQAKAYTIDLNTVHWRTCSCSSHHLLRTCQESRRAVFEYIGPLHTLEFSIPLQDKGEIVDWLTHIDSVLLESFRRVFIWRSDPYRHQYRVVVDSHRGVIVESVGIGTLGKEGQELKEELTPIYESLPFVKGRPGLTRCGLLELVDAIGRVANVQLADTRLENTRM